MEEAEKNHQQAEQQQAAKQEDLQSRKQRRREERGREQRKRATKKAISIAAVVIVVGGGIAGLGWFFSTRPSFPPMSDVNHVEQSPPAHILDQPISEAIQRHMLEHADGEGKPGIIIQYNCKDYDCTSDLVGKLTELVKRYPDNVYLAPNTYSGKIILTKNGRREILDTFDEQAIKKFIER